MHHGVMRLTDALRRAARPTALTAALLGAGAIAGRPDDPEYYRSLEQAPFAPPSWAFGPAWTVAKLGWSVAVVRGTRSVRGPDRRALLALAIADAGVYVSFSYVYFRKRSPMLAAVWTVADAVLTATAIPLLARHDRTAAAALAPQAAWLSLAAPVAVYQAAANPDPLLSR